MAVDKIPETMKKAKPLPHETEKSMRDTSVGMMGDVKLDKNGGLTHKDTKTKKLPTDLI